MSQLLETPLIFILLLIALIDTSARKQLFEIRLTVKIDLVEVVCYLKHVFHLLYDKSVTLVEALLYFSLIS